MIIAALKGGAGKTILSLGLAAAWKHKGFHIAPFKKGPDFIDAAWLTLAAGSPCYNLDAFMMTEEEILQSLTQHSTDADLSLIEGNRGLFDGLDSEGCCSTSELAKLTRCPVVLIVDVTMVTRTVAALVLGCQNFDRDLKIAGVILNRVAGPRQEALIRASIAYYCGLPVLGAVPKLKDNPFPERHMGLVPHHERAHAEKAIDWTRNTVERHLDLDALWSLSRKLEALPEPRPAEDEGFPLPDPSAPPRIGYIKDPAFWFYYPENLTQFEKMGAVLVKIDSFRARELPPIDALYIGGGFPETQAPALAENRAFRESLRQKIDARLPVYAECGGLLYLGKNLISGEKIYPMVGALPLSFIMEKKPQGHGYTVLEADRDNPYHPVGQVFRGHEFHYSRPVPDTADGIRTVFKVVRGQGLDGRRDGLSEKNLLATYTHIHAAGNTSWGKNFLRAALRFRASMKTDIRNVPK